MTSIPHPTWCARTETDGIHRSKPIDLQRSGDKLTIEAKLGGRSQVITFEQGGKGNVETYLGVTGTHSIKVHLAPGAKPAVA